MEPHPTLDQLEVFVAVAREGSFSAAARKLNRAQSVVSYAIANLEAQLDVTLFARSGARQPRLTPAGEVLIEDARRMVADLQALRNRTRGLRQGLEAELSLAVDALVPRAVLTAVLSEFRDVFPTVKVRLHTGILGAVADLVINREAGIGIGSGLGLEGDELVERRIGGNQIVPVAAPEHPLAGAQGPVPTASVREHFQIVIADPTAHTRGRDFHVHAFNTWRVTDAATKHALLLAGLGWGGLPLWMVEEDMEAGRLVELSLEAYPRSSHFLYAIRRADSPFGPAARWLVARYEKALVQFCTEKGLHDPPATTAPTGRAAE